MKFVEILPPVRMSKVRIYYVVLSRNRRFRHTRYRDINVPFYANSELDGRNKLSKALLIDRATEEIRAECLLNEEEYITRSIVEK